MAWHGLEFVCILQRVSLFYHVIQCEFLVSFAETEILCKHFTHGGWGSASPARALELSPKWCKACLDCCPILGPRVKFKFSTCCWLGAWLESWELQCSESHGVDGIGQKAGEVLRRSLSLKKCRFHLPNKALGLPGTGGDCHEL